MYEMSNLNNNSLELKPIRKWCIRGVQTASKLGPSTDCQTSSSIVSKLKLSFNYCTIKHIYCPDYFWLRVLAFLLKVVEGLLSASSANRKDHP